MIDLVLGMEAGNRSDLQQNDEPGFHSTPQMKTNCLARSVQRVARRQRYSALFDRNDCEGTQYDLTTRQPTLPELAEGWTRTGLTSGFGYLGPSQAIVFTAAWYCHV